MLEKMTTRQDLAALADRLLLGVRPHFSPGRARIDLPQAASSFGARIDGAETFTRTLLLAALQVAGDGGSDPRGFLDDYAQGIATGTDPASDERWARLDEHEQARVDAAGLALALDISRPWLWERLDPTVQQQVIDHLSPAATHALPYPLNHSVWYRIITNTFLASVGGPHDEDGIAVDLAQHDLFNHTEGWTGDGETRAYDHYNHWALHAYPTLWSAMTGAGRWASERRAADREHLGRFLADAIGLVGADGAPLFQGRGLTYRFATGTPFWVGALSGVDGVGMGLLRETAMAQIRYFLRHGVPGSDDLLHVGWFHPWPALGQPLSGAGSPYFAVMGFLGLLLPADHPVWTAPAEDLAVARRDDVRTIAGPGWLVSSTAADGIVRVANHGTDNSVTGAQVIDNPFFARLGYSTATTPLLDRAGIEHPLDQSATLVSAGHEAAHRTGFDLVDLRRLETDAGPVGVAASVADVRWSHGTEVTSAGVVTVVSILRGATEIRLVRASAVSPLAAGLRIGGWSVTGQQPVREQVGAGVQARTPEVCSSISVLTGSAMAGIDVRDGASPLGHTSATPFLQFPAAEREWVAVAIHLGREPMSGAPRIEVDGTMLGIIWPDGEPTAVRIPVLAVP